MLLDKGYFISGQGFSNSYFLHILWEFLDFSFSKVGFFPKQSPHKRYNSLDILLKGRYIDMGFLDRTAVFTWAGWLPGFLSGEVEE